LKDKCILMYEIAQKTLFIFPKGGFISMRKILLICLLVIMVSYLVGCQDMKNTPQEPSEIMITIDNQTIDYVVGKNKWDGAVFDREDTFKTILKKDSKKVVPYIKLGKTLNIEFKENPPDTIEIFDYLLHEDGNKKYTSKEIVQIPVKLKDGKCSFDFKENPAVFLSSKYDEYEAGRTLRGFKVICRWGKNEGANECEYGFIIRTDAKKEESISPSLITPGQKVYNIPAKQQKQNYSVEDFKQLYSEYLKLNNITLATSPEDDKTQMSKEDKLKYYTIYDITPKEVKEEVGCQIFKINYSCETYVVYKSKVFHIGFGFGGLGIVSLMTCDFDGNGQKDLIYTFSFGSGLHRSQIGVFNFSKEKEEWPNFSQLNNDVMLEKISDDNFKIYIAKVEDVINFIHFNLSKQEYVANVNSSVLKQ
jgi:hypothetical protein